MRLSLVTGASTTDFPPRRSPAPDPAIPTLVVLRAGALVPAAAAVHGTYHDVYSRLFQNALATLDRQAPQPEQRQLQIISYNVAKIDDGAGGGEVVEYPDREIIQRATAILITGSAATAYDSDEWITTLVEFCQTELQSLSSFSSSSSSTSPQSQQQHSSTLPKKWFGICFGHQILARALGSPVTQNPAGWELGVTEIHLSSEVGQKVFENPPSGPSVLRIHQVHRDHVPALPPATHSIGSTASCPLQGFVRFTSTAPPLPFDLTQTTILTLQGHPEFSPDILRHTIDAREKSGVFSPELVAKARARANEHDDGVYIAVQFLKIMGI